MDLAREKRAYKTKGLQGTHVLQGGRLREKKPLHVITSRTVGVWCTAGTRLPGTSTYRLVLVDLPVPGTVLLGPRVGLA